MATTYQDIFDLFLVSIKDYKIDNLYVNSQTDFEAYLTGFLEKAIPNFDNCVKDLTLRSKTSMTFNLDLDDLEKDILADLMVYQWFLKELQNITQFNITLSDTDFKHFSEAQNLREKTEYANRVREIYEQKKVVYGMKNISWGNWGTGQYG